MLFPENQLSVKKDSPVSLMVTGDWWMNTSYAKISLQVGFGINGILRNFGLYSRIPLGLFLEK